MTLAVHHLAVSVADPSRVAPIYRAAGFSEVRDTGVGGQGAGEQGAGEQWFAAPNAFIQVVAASRPPGPAERARRVCDQGITHFCVQSGDAGAIWQALADAGTAFIGPPVRLGTGILYVYGNDGEGNTLELEGVSDAPGAAPWIGHIAWASADLDRLADFYARLVGRGVHNTGRFANAVFEQVTGLPGVDVSAQWLMADNMGVEMWRYHNPPTLPAAAPQPGAPGYAWVGFSSGDLTADLARIAAAGIVLEPGGEVAGQAAWGGADPDGNAVRVFAEPPAGHPLARAGLSAPDFVSERMRDVLQPA